MAEALQRGINKVISQIHNTGESLTHCIDCEEPIPEDRRQKVAGCKRCVGCQEIVEFEQKTVYRRNR